MQVTHKDKTELTITLNETFDYKCVRQFRESYEQADKQLCKIINISFTNTKYMDSSALGMLLNLDKTANVIGAKVILINTDEKIQKILRIARFEKKFTIQ